MSVDQMMQSVSTTWANVPPVQRRFGLAITLVVAGVLAALALAGRSSSQWSVLYSHLTPDGASQVVTALEAHHIPFRPSDDGTSVLVAPDRLAATRIQLAGEGLPTGIVGFGLFDHLPLGASDTVEHVDYMRALEGQLTQAVEALGEVRGAQVMLSLPETSTYTSADRPAHAAVMVSLQPGAELSSSEVRAITHLVASSVEGLTPDRVSVADDHGRLLAAGAGEADGSVSGSELDSLEQSTEERVHNQIAALVDAVAGPGKAVIEVRADISAAQVQTVEDQPTAGVPVSQQSTQEVYAGGPGAFAAPLPNIGATGTTPGRQPNATAAPQPNTAGTGALTRPPTYGPAAGGAGAGSANEYQRTLQTTNFHEGVRHTETKDPGGQIDRLAITVFIDNSVGLTTADSIQRAIASGYLNPKRGDTVMVTRVPFAQATTAAGGFGTGPAASASKSGPSMVMVAAGAGVGLVVLGALGFFLMRGRRKAPAPAPAPAAPAPVMPEIAPSGSETDSELAQQVAEWARRNPAVSADVVRAWWGNGGQEGSTS